MAPAVHVTLIAAVAKNGVIGRDNRLPWRLPEDLQFFKQTTLGHTIVMGRKTYESIGRPLPGRRSLVVTRNPQQAIAGVELCGSLMEALSRCSAGDEVFVTGGAGLFAEALRWSDRLLITQIDRSFEGDTYFPSVPDDFRETSRSAGHSAADPTLAFAFVEYRRPIPERD